MDIMTAAERSQRMALIRSKDTKAELAVRRLVHRMGYRYRLHTGKLPGRPDLVFSKKRKVIFVHGCFWHSHRHCPKCRPPKSRLDYWAPKLERNRERDVENERKLRKHGWRVLIVWECQVKELDAIAGRIQRFLEG